MNDDQNPTSESPDQSLVDREILRAAVQATVDKDVADAPMLVENEPLLSQYLRDGVLQVLGKIAYAGAGPGIVRDISEDVVRLLGVTATSLQCAYRNLLDGLLPELDAPASDVAGPSSENSDQPGES